MLLRENREGILEGVAEVDLSLNGCMVGERKGLLLSLSIVGTVWGGGGGGGLSLC